MFINGNSRTHSLYINSLSHESQNIGKDDFYYEKFKDALTGKYAIAFAGHSGEGYAGDSTEMNNNIR